MFQVVRLYIALKGLQSGPLNPSPVGPGVAQKSVTSYLGKTIANIWVGKHLKSSSLPAQSRKLLVLSALTAMETQSAKMMRNREDINSFHTCGGGIMTFKKILRVLAFWHI